MRAKSERVARARLAGAMKGLIEKSKNEGRDFTSLEREPWDKMSAEFDKLNAAIQRADEGSPIDEFTSFGGSIANLGTTADDVRARIMASLMYLNCLY